jgi:hypothetical protein
VSPQRIQRQRVKGWRMPENTLYVGRGSKWGNPINLSDLAAQYPSFTIEQLAGAAVGHFEDLVRLGTITFSNWRSADGKRGPITWHYPPVEVIRGALAGRDLACWCAPDQPCHADVLLDLANRDADQ